MFLFKVASAALPLAATSDEIQPWMIAAIAAGAVFALILIVVAARKARGPKGEDIREAMVAAKQEAAENLDATGSVGQVASQQEASAPVATPSKAGKSSGKGKHAR